MVQCDGPVWPDSDSPSQLQVVMLFSVCSLSTLVFKSHSEPPKTFACLSCCLHDNPTPINLLLASSMELMRVPIAVAAIFALVTALVLPAINAQSPAPAPTSDGVAIDQGIAYGLMLAALILTYLIH